MKYARLTYNSNNYLKPSGILGKSNSKNTFEGRNKFGWEEWLFNDAFTFDGYRFGFIQAFQNRAPGIYNHIWLYNFNNNTKEFCVVACINEIEKLTESQTIETEKKYRDKKLIELMLNGIQDIDSNNNIKKDYLNSLDSFSNVCNVRFKIKHLIKYNVETVQNFNLRYSNLYTPDSNLTIFFNSLTDKK